MVETEFYKILFNWEDITEGVASYEHLQNLTLSRRLCFRNNNDIFKIKYINWRELITWDSDEVIIKNIIKPKYKVWDYVVWENKKAKVFIKINTVQYFKERFIYNAVALDNDSGMFEFKEKYLRKPTKEELDIYFR